LIKKFPLVWEKYQKTAGGGVDSHCILVYCAAVRVISISVAIVYQLLCFVNVVL